MKFLISFFAVVLFCQAVIHLPVKQQGRYGAIEWRSEQEKKEFHRLLRKHGQHKQISVIFYEKSKAYYIDRKGRKCLFK